MRSEDNEQPYTRSQRAQPQYERFDPVSFGHRPHRDRTWRLIWFKHQGNSQPPRIDFSHEMVVAVFAGPRPTSEYALEIVSVTREEGSLVVRYHLQVDAAKAMPPLATAPFHIIAVPAEHAPVKFRPILEERLGGAITATASLVWGAWDQAGRPPLRSDRPRVPEKVRRE